MGMLGFCIYVILPVLALGIDSEAVVNDVWPEIGGGFLAESLLQTPHLSDVGFNPPVPFHIWNLMDLTSSFDIKVMNSSWSGPAESNIYRKGDSMYLQVSASTIPEQELYIQSCYATSSPDPVDKSRLALIFKKGCVSSKQSVIEFISRQRDSINLRLDTSRLKLSEIYVHCSVVLSSTLTPDTKSCNYNKSKFSWVELDGQSSVCECCASKCKGPPYYGAPSNALVSTGPLTVMEGGTSLSSSFNATTEVVSSTGTNQIVPGMFPSSVKKGWIAAGAAVSGHSNVPYSSSWLSKPVGPDTMMGIIQHPGSALSLWLPGLLLDVSPNPVLEMVINIPQQKLVGVSNKDGEKTLSETSPEAMHQEANVLKSGIPELLHEDYMADSLGLMNDWVVEGFNSPDKELRGDVFMNYKWPQPDDLPDSKVNGDALASPLPQKLPETPLEKDDEMMVLEQTEKVQGEPEYMKKTKLRFTQASDGSSSLSYQEEEMSPSVGEQEVRKRTLEMERRPLKDDRSSKTLEKDLMQSLLDLVRGLNKEITDQ